MDGARGPRSESSSGITFEGLVMLFGTTALLQLGAAPDPTSGQRRIDLDQAKETIELLELLKEKTKGNLTIAEGEVLDGVLFDLRCRYVDAAKGD